MSSTVFSCDSSYECSNFSFIEFQNYYSCSDGNCSSKLLVGQKLVNCTSFSCNISIVYGDSEQCVD